LRFGRINIDPERQWWRPNERCCDEIPVTPEAAEALGDLARRQRVGKLVSSMLRPESPDADPLAAMFASIKSAALADGLTDEDIEAELAAYNAEGRL
jgi:hypothetical protein